MTPERLQQIRELTAGLRDEAEHDIEDTRDIYQALTELIVEAEGLMYWSGVFTMLQSQPVCVAETRIVTDPQTGVSRLARVPQPFTVK